MSGADGGVRAIQNSLAGDPMVKSDAGREYVSETLNEAHTRDSVWTCLECGCLVGPLRRHRDIHDQWHATIDAAIA
jgi:hypothetical protein